jgi:hypothetical protein
MAIKPTGSGLGAEPFFVRDEKKTGGFSSGLGFAPMGADAGQFFPSQVYASLIRLCSIHFLQI